MNIEIPPVNMTVIAPLTTLFAWASALLLVDVFLVPEKRKAWTGYLALAGLLLTAVVALVVQLSVPITGDTSIRSFSGMVVLDTFALTITWIFVIIAAITIAISIDYLPRHDIELGEFYPLVLFATGGMILLGQSTNLIMIFLGIELLSITLYVLTAFFYPRFTSEEAGMKYLLLGAFAAGFFVYGIALVYGGAGTVDLVAIGAFLSTQPPPTPGALPNADVALILVGSGLILVAFGFKIALVPFHMWTPDVYEGSPTPVAAYMSVGTKGAALAALLRILLIAIPLLSTFWVPVLGALAVMTMLLGNIGALQQNNVKRMLAYSSIGHAGYILLGVMAASSHGTEGFLFYLLAYALANLGAFAILIALERRGEAAWNIDDFAGLWQRRPLLAMAMATFMLSLAGVPPTAGFFGKFLVFAAAWEDGLGILVFFGVLTSAIAAYFYLRIIMRMFMEEPVREIEPVTYRGLMLTIVLALVGTLFLGLIPTPLIDLVQDSLIALAPG